MKSSDSGFDLESRLTKILGSYDARPDTNALHFALSSPRRGWSFDWGSPGAPAQYFIASATKLYVSALIMQLRQEGLLELDTPAASYLSPQVMAGIHVFHGVDASARITVRQLLSHTSGIADYFEQRQRDGSSQFKKALASDFAWSFEDVLRITRQQLSPHFPPARPGKAFYSDSNFQLLGALIEAITGDRYEAALQQRILQPLGLSDTYPFTMETLDRYDRVAAMLYDKKRLVIPQAMASVRADGGIVSTARDGITFLQAFMTGALFPLPYLDEMQQHWNRIFMPLEYGIGIMRFALPRYFSPLKTIPPMVGHSGASGALLFWVPELDLYISGTVNQVKKRSLSYNLMTRLVMLCLGAWGSKN